MTVEILHGCCLEQMAAMAAAGRTVDALTGALSRLDSGICNPMAGAAQRYQVGEIVGFPIVGKHPVGADMVNIRSGFAAMLAYAAISVSRLPLLSLPIRAAISSLTAEVLRVKRSYAVRIPASARTVFARPYLGFAGRMGWRSLVFAAAADAGKCNFLSQLRLDGGVLTRGRTGLASSMLKSRRDDGESFPASLASNVSHAVLP